MSALAISRYVLRRGKDRLRALNAAFDQLYPYESLSPDERERRQARNLEVERTREYIDTLRL